MKFVFHFSLEMSCLGLFVICIFDHYKLFAEAQQQACNYEKTCVSAPYLSLMLWISLRIFSVLSAILYLGNVTYKSKSTGRDEGLEVGPPEVLATLSDLLKVTSLIVSVWFFLLLLLAACMQMSALCTPLWVPPGQGGAAGRSTY